MPKSTSPVRSSTGERERGNERERQREWDGEREKEGGGGGERERGGERGFLWSEKERAFDGRVGVCV